MFASDPVEYDYHDTAQQKAMVESSFKDAGWELPKLLKSMHDAPDFYFDSISQVHMTSLARERVVLLGDAGYCASPASGQGTSLALVGAYVLAGELATAAGHSQAFASYQQEMSRFIELNQQLGVRVLKDMVPRSKWQVWFQNMAMRVMLHLPNKERIFRSMISKTQQAVNDAANGIDLKSYHL
jgi:2-polyprenyl-6-methoxyphenol hydroxylase-like FAD-dependent oxidoreductase